MSEVHHRSFDCQLIRLRRLSDDGSESSGCGTFVTTPEKRSESFSESEDGATSARLHRSIP